MKYLAGMTKLTMNESKYRNLLRLYVNDEECLLTPIDGMYAVSGFLVEGSFGYLVQDMELFPGYKIWSMQFDIRESTTFTLEIGKPLITFLYSLGHDHEYFIDGLSLPLKSQHYLIAQFVPHKISVPLSPGTYIVFGITIDRATLQSWVKEFPILEHFLKRLTIHRPELLLPEPVLISRKIMDLITQIQHSKYRGNQRIRHIDIKTQELIFLSMSGLLTPNKRSTTRDFRRLEQARGYLQNHLRTPGSVSDLAKLVGMNQYTLRMQFKHTYGQTIFDFLTEERMVASCKLLVDSEMPIGEIAHLVGYANLPAFSNAFFRYHGYRPSYLRNGLSLD